jgi:predicted aconitase with swiveling domain
MKFINAEFLVPGDARGPVTVLSAPLSFYGGYDIDSGTIADATHPQRGVSLAGRIMAMRAARGSSSSASALVEAARDGKAPAAIILGRLDPILVIGGLVAFDLYRVAMPILLLPEASWDVLHSGAVVSIDSRSSSIGFE